MGQTLNPDLSMGNGLFFIWHRKPLGVSDVKRTAGSSFSSLHTFSSRMSFFGPFQWIESVSSLRGYGSWLHRKDAATLWK